MNRPTARDVYLDTQGLFKTATYPTASPINIAMGYFEVSCHRRQPWIIAKSNIHRHLVESVEFRPRSADEERSMSLGKLLGASTHLIRLFSTRKIAFGEAASW
jgi:hypothetical protein